MSKKREVVRLCYVILDYISYVTYVAGAFRYLFFWFQLLIFIANVLTTCSVVSRAVMCVLYWTRVCRNADLLCVISIKQSLGMLNEMATSAFSEYNVSSYFQINAKWCCLSSH
jgi:hypothetical protein